MEYLRLGIDLTACWTSLSEDNTTSDLVSVAAIFMVATLTEFFCYNDILESRGMRTTERTEVEAELEFLQF
jgi:hypothetical protein